MTLIGNRKLKGGSVGGHNIKKIYCGLNTVFSSKLPVKPVLPSDTTAYPMHKTVNGVLMFAVRLGDKHGYYAPSTNTFSEELGMSGNYIERVEYVSFNGSQYIDSGKKLHGDDTVKAVFRLNNTETNIFGARSSKTSGDYYLYISPYSSESIIRYSLSSYRIRLLASEERYDICMTPTGFYFDGIRLKTWTSKTFTTTGPMWIGHVSDSSSAKMDGDLYSLRVTGTTKANLIPVKIMNMYCMLDTDSWSIPTVSGTLSGGAVTGKDIPFPDVIYQQGGENL